MRYAISSAAGVFHLLAKSEDKTLCGLSVAPIIINRPARSDTLYLTEVVGAAHSVCDECVAIESESEIRQP